MAVRDFYHDIDLQKVSQLLNARIHNVTNASRATLASGLSGSHEGLLVYDTEDDLLYTWDGSAFNSIGGTTGAMVFQGVVGYDAAEPGSPSVGDYYVFNTAGTNTWNTSDVVQIGDAAVWNGTDWSFIQGNTVQASETVQGIIELATTTEAATGTDTSRAVTPAGLTSFASGKAFAKTYFVSGQSLTADTPKTITHNLGLQNRDACVVGVFDSSHNGISVDVDTTDTNSLTVTSAVALTGVQVVVIGF